jgi:alkanesulfonate monooxygenase SsuD/methylene tetrahydromethanopterin reductase-like flavin-dependent oxidoreductase (luciferase family)
VTQEQTLGPKPQLGPIETMTYAAACTQRLRLGCAVFVSTLHSPVHLARSISSLDQISRGRIEIGFGTGRKGRLFAAFGVDPERYVARFTEGIEVMTRLWRDPASPLIAKGAQAPRPDKSEPMNSHRKIKCALMPRSCALGVSATGHRT